MTQDCDGLDPTIGAGGRHSSFGGADPARRANATGPHYSPAQIEAALGPVFGVDRQLIRDGTYFVVEHDAQLVGCGGWSRRKADNTY